MKFLVLIAALLPTIVHADYIPGRVRVDASAQMEVLQATGLYQNVKNVQMVSLVTDGKGLTGYRLIVDGQAMNFQVTKEGKNTGCGMTSEAVEKENVEVAASTVLSIKDMSLATCEIVVSHIWQVTIETRPYGRSGVSTLVLGGNPEHLMHTM